MEEKLLVETEMGAWEREVSGDAGLSDLSLGGLEVEQVVPQRRELALAIDHRPALGWRPSSVSGARRPES